MPQSFRKHIQRQGLEAKALTTNSEPAPWQSLVGSLQSYWQWAGALAAKVCCFTGLMCPEQYQHDGDTVTQTSLIYSRIAFDLRLGIHKHQPLLLSSQFLLITAVSKSSLGLDDKGIGPNLSISLTLSSIDRVGLSFLLGACQNLK